MKSFNFTPFFSLTSSTHTTSLSTTTNQTKRTKKKTLFRPPNGLTSTYFSSCVQKIKSSVATQPQARFFFFCGIKKNRHNTQRYLIFRLHAVLSRDINKISNSRQNLYIRNYKKLIRLWLIYRKEKKNYISFLREKVKTLKFILNYVH